MSVRGFAGEYLDLPAYGSSDLCDGLPHNAENEKSMSRLAVSRKHPTVRELRASRPVQAATGRMELDCKMPCFNAAMCRLLRRYAPR